MIPGSRGHFRSFAPTNLTVASTVLLQHLDADFSDTKGHTIAVSGNASIVSSGQKLGSGCASFDGSGDFYQLPTGATDLNMGTGDFMIDTYFLSNGNSSGRGCLCEGNSTNGLISFHSGSSYVTYVYPYPGNSLGFTLTTGVWMHIRISRASGVLYLFKDGTLVGSMSETRTVDLNGLYFGAAEAGSPGTYDLNGRIDEVRIVKGYASTTNFTPPTIPYT